MTSSGLLFTRQVMAEQKQSLQCSMNSVIIIYSYQRRNEGTAFPCHMPELAATNHKQTSPLCVRIFPSNDVEF